MRQEIVMVRNPLQRRVGINQAQRLAGRVLTNIGLNKMAIG
ncbi:Uncharacterised protein [Klebsiella pneumoniae]|nr:Uncharacterised protein [Klebsiella pneumoniae]